MTRQVTTILTAVLLGCGNSSPTGSTDETELGQTEEVQVGSQAGQKPIDFTLTDLDGRSVGLGSLQGKPIYLNFWTTWCGPCVAEMPDIERLQQTLGAQIAIVGINLGEPVPQVRAFVQGNGYTWTFLQDTAQQVGSEYGVTAIPTSIFVNAKGVITSRQVGMMSFESMKQLADSAIKG